jgi:mono/diheme cytochrome c family protein
MTFPSVARGRAPVRALLSLLGVALVGCPREAEEIDLERMVVQRRGQAYRASSYFADGRVMQAPVDGTVPTSDPFGSEGWLEGTEAAQFVGRVPEPLTRELLQLGRSRYETFCAACHGVDGSGESRVARSMSLRPPASLVTEPVRSMPPGRIFRAATRGYGLMPSYERALNIRERWAVVAYVRVLQRCHHTPLDDLSAADRARAVEELSR